MMTTMMTTMPTNTNEFDAVEGLLKSLFAV